MVVNTETLKDNPDLGKALVGIWYETMALMQDPGAKGKAAREAMAKLSGTDLAGFEAQLKTTRMFYTPKDALGFTSGAELPKIMDLVRTFCFEHNLLGEKVQIEDAIGIEMPAASPRRQEEREAALRPDLHEDGRRRQALTGDGAQRRA